MKRLASSLALALPALALLILPAVALAQDDNTLLELVKSDVQSEKKEIIADALPLTETQSAAFWPVYNKYSTDLRKIYDERLAIMKDYAASVDSLTDKQAKSLVDRSFKAEADLNKLKAKYYKDFTKAVGPKVAGNFFQYENTLLRIIDLKLGIVGLAIPKLKNP